MSNKSFLKVNAQLNASRSENKKNMQHDSLNLKEGTFCRPIQKHLNQTQSSIRSQ